MFDVFVRMNEMIRTYNLWSVTPSAENLNLFDRAMISFIEILAEYSARFNEIEELT